MSNAKIMACLCDFCYSRADKSLTYQNDNLVISITISWSAYIHASIYFMANQLYHDYHLQDNANNGVKCFTKFALIHYMRNSSESFPDT